MKRTRNYNLKKPSQTDHYDVEHFNGNSDIIDEALQRHETGKEPVRTLATEPEADAGVETGIRAWSPQRIRRAMRDGARTGLLTGLTTQTDELAAADTILTALGKAMGRINLRAPTASPAFTGTPTAPTPAATTNNTQLATTAFAEPRQAAVTDAELDAGTLTTRRGFTPANIARAVRNTLLTGYAVGANAAVAAGDRVLTAIGKLQAQINARAVAGSQTRIVLPLNAGWSNMSGFTSYYSRNPFNEVTVSIAVQRNADIPAGFTNFGSLPSGFRPQVHTPAGAHISSNLPGRVQVNSDGHIVVAVHTPAGGERNIFANVSFPAQV